MLSKAYAGIGALLYGRRQMAIPSKAIDFRPLVVKLKRYFLIKMAKTYKPGEFVVLQERGQHGSLCG